MSDYTTPEGLVIPYPDAVLKVIDCSVTAQLKVLKSVSKELQKEEALGEDYQKLASMMVRTMLDSNGVGLAAVQVDVPKSMIVVWDDWHEKPMVVLNPRVVATTRDEQENKEQCLSVPGVQVVVRRPFEVRVTGKTLDWQDYDNKFSHELAAIFSHEAGHTLGELLLDHLGSLQRKLYLEKVRKIKKRAKRLAKQYVKEQRHGANEQDERQHDVEDRDK